MLVTWSVTPAFKASLMTSYPSEKKKKKEEKKKKKKKVVFFFFFFFGWFFSPIPSFFFFSTWQMSSLLAAPLKSLVLILSKRLLMTAKATTEIPFLPRLLTSVLRAASFTNQTHNKRGSEIARACVEKERERERKREKERERGRERERAPTRGLDHPEATRPSHHKTTTQDNFPQGSPSKIHQT